MMQEKRMELSPFWMPPSKLCPLAPYKHGKTAQKKINIRQLIKNRYNKI